MLAHGCERVLLLLLLLLLMMRMMVGGMHSMFWGG
jgi:hypothetical protein